MKRVFSFSLVFLLLSISSADSFAQNGKAVVIPKKVVYRRETVEENDFRSTFQIVYPRILIAGKNSVARRITNTLNYEKVFGFTIAEEKQSRYLIDANYKLNYNKNGFLDITLFTEAVGAYPWTETRYFVFDLKTGVQVKLSELFAPRSIGKMIGKIKTAMRRDVKRHKMQPEEAFSFKYEFSFDRLQLKDLEGFSISDQGMTFIFDYNFNFASLADEPAGRYFFKWSEMKPFIKADGLLGKFVR